ncbi:MAG: type III-B CRISPR module-associated protein Cmr3 [Chloroflexi bacterium]|nr:type III-B CRISPR module-associated protein Cmr3 [Chloroflexota bacterium]
MSMRIFIEPEDVWLFRDGKPFDAGSDHRARSLFPPYPNVMQGIIRSHQLILQDIPLTKKDKVMEAVGTATEYKGLRLRGPFVAKYKDGKLSTYFPVPADATPCSDDEVKSTAPRICGDGVITSHEKATLPRLCFANGIEPGKRDYGNWLTFDALQDCLNGNAVKPVRDDELFERESRLGIEIEADRARVTKEGQLYQAEFIRPCPDVGLYVEFEGYDWADDQGLLRMAGEGRGGRYQSVNGSDWLVPEKPLPRLFKVYFASPAYFSQGWRPEKWGTFFEGDVLLEAVALKGYETIGGYDLANNQQKAAYRFVPAGSVYYFSSHGAAKLKDGLVQNAITESFNNHDDIAKIGFGQVIIKEWKEK